MKEPDFGSKELYYICHLLQTTLESGIDVGRGIDVEPGKFGKKNNKKVQTYVDKIIKLGNSYSPWLGKVSKIDKRKAYVYSGL